MPPISSLSPFMVCGIVDRCVTMRSLGVQDRVVEKTLEKNWFQCIRSDSSIGVGIIGWLVNYSPFEIHLASILSGLGDATVKNSAHKATTREDVDAGSESRPPMLNKENYVPWSSRLLRYAKSRPNGKLIYNSIINGPYARRIIPEPGDTNREVPVNETFHVQTDDELTKKELKQIEANDQAIQTILLGLPEDIYAAVDSCEIAQEIWFQVQQMMKGSDIGIQEKKAKLFYE
uniref:Uncharacterized protein n=1 Tax=Tanacetum cinerariifolium TaxID=118510 RepID=A0A6L2P460_TANCI|nr:hypothetical protein [Tanacetum cinerariifolium]